MARSREMTRIGRYDLLAPVGEGGMARVFLARQRGPAGFEKIVVVKLIHPHLAVQKQFVNMFLDEARIAAMINHARVVQVFDLGVDDDTYYMVLEYLAGETFTTVLETGSLAPKVGARIIACVAEGLHAAHELCDVAGRPLQVVHRDVSPGNVIVKYDGGVKVLDFGVAKARGRLAESTGGRMKGKFSYMAPEQIASKPVDRRTDIFSLGILLWETLAGRRLFRRKNEAATVNAIMTKRPPPPSRYGADVTTALDRVALRALSFQPAKRYQTAQQMRQALLAALPPDEDEIAAHMQTAFASNMNDRQGMMRRLLEDVEEVDGDFLATVSDSFSVEPEKSLSLPSAASLAMTHKWGSPVDIASDIASDNDLDSEYDDADVDRDIPPDADLNLSELASGDHVAVGSDEFASTTAPEDIRDGTREVPSYDADGYSKPGAAKIRGKIRGARAMAGVETTVDLGASSHRPAFRWGLVGVATTSVIIAVVTTIVVILRPGSAENEFVQPTEVPAAGIEATTGDDSAAGEDADAAPGRPGSTAPAPQADRPAELAGSAQRKPAQRRAAQRGARKGRPSPASASARVLYDSGIRSLIAGRLADAKAKFKDAIAADGRHAPAYRGLGLVNERLGKRGPALKWFRRYLEVDPSAPDAESIRKRITNLGG